MVANVVFGLPINKVFNYYLPDGVENSPLGVRVRAPFNNKEEIGYLIGVEEIQMQGLKKIVEIIDKEPILDKDILELISWMAKHYFSSQGECIEASIPPLLRKGRSSIKPRLEYEIKPDESFNAPLMLTEAQTEAFNTLKADIWENQGVFLLYGVTGSGKTEIYIKIIEEVLKKGRGAIILVPEIALTPQTISRFKKRLGENISVFHSGLTEAQRFKEWNNIKTNKTNICIGTRSAIFAPLKNLGLIIVDDEHESSYKQEDMLRYHARDVAIKRGEISNCSVILGSATPSLESYYKAKKGEYRLLVLPERVSEKKMPEVRIVDLKSVRHKKGMPLIFSPQLIEELRAVLERKMQAILFLNRRGFSTYVTCLSCGYVAKCVKCSIALTYHSKLGVLICHHCNYSQKKPSICPECNRKYLSFSGFGTQRVESELHKIFSGIRSARLDSDALSKRGSLDEIIDNFRNRKIDVLIGTQIVAKGHDFPDVELVGVILADLSLNIIDFRAGERTFSLLTQVAGRSGRGDKEGRVIIQTYNPEHYTIKTSLKHDYISFYEEEIERRKLLKLPPFSKLVKIEVRHKDENKLKRVIESIKKKLLLKIPAADVLGPAPNAVNRIRNLYRWALLAKGEDVEELNSLLYSIIGFRRKIEGANIIVDVNPYED